MGIREIHELRGRAPEVLFEEARRANAKIPVEQIQYFRMAVYFAENDFPEIAKLHPEAWKHSPTDPSL